ncbi:ATPase PAAT isoform X3 [Cololabis saira]|uniref:ATPase PAAT isoform X3 n=1 Tax=Cololabis saira TaxID=129043 RepID=UPI002AD25902|nr:ATPase PAAT isoform X3 [Cololabis saira]
MVDISVKSEAAWVCQTPGRRLADVLLPVNLGNEDGDEEELGASVRKDTGGRAGPVLLERLEDGEPCVLTLRCSPTASSSSSIRRLLLVTEARTMEVYDRAGEYCGTVRGTKDQSIQPDGADRGPFYRKQLTLQHPSSACDVKLLSLAGRGSVQVCSVVVGLQSLQPGPDRGPGIDLQQVQSLVQEMGTSLSPAAQNLMDMVQHQQKNQTGSLGSFLPLLMGGGALSALAGGLHAPPAGLRSQRQPADFTPADQTPPFQNGGTSEDSSAADLSPSSADTTSSEGGVPVSHAHLAEMASRFLKGRDHGHLGPELLPMLQSVCGQVTQLRLDNAAEAEKERMENGTWELDSAMERRLEEMERRLKEHVDRRLDALEQKLEKVLLSVLPMATLSHQAGVKSPGGASEQVTPTH